MHGVVLLLILTVALRPTRVEPQVPVEFEVVERPKPPPPPPPEPPQPKEEERRKAEPVKVAKALKLPPSPKDAPPPPPKTEPSPPEPNELPPPDAKPNAPLMIGISMSSTTIAGGFAAPVGNTLYGSAPKTAPKPEEVKPYAPPPPGGRYVPPFKVTRLPELVADFKAPYPEEARKLGLEGQVMLRLTVDGGGKVARATLIKGCGHGLDEAALDAVRRFRFRPGTDVEEAVTTEITYVYTFLLD